MARKVIGGREGSRAPVGGDPSKKLLLDKTELQFHPREEDSFLGRKETGYRSAKKETKTARILDLAKRPGRNKD